MARATATIREFAELMGVGVRTAYKWRERDGFPVLKGGRVDVERARKWVEGNVSQSMGRPRKVPRVAPQVVPEPDVNEDRPSAAVQKSRIDMNTVLSRDPPAPDAIPAWEEPARRKDFELAVRYWVDNQKALGNLIERDLVFRIWKKHVLEAKNRLEQFPDALSVLVTPEGLQAILDRSRDSTDLKALWKSETESLVRDLLRILGKAAVEQERIL